MDDIKNGNIPTKVDVHYYEDSVVFSISSCSCDKHYGLSVVDRSQAKILINKIQYFEKMSWRTLSGLGRKNGLTVEEKHSESFGMIDEQNNHKFIGEEKYYFHIRIEKIGTFRIFGYQYKQVFYITHIDPRGKIHSH